MRKILFIYNADSDIFSALSDFAHKMFSPKTYQCNLCALTYGNITMRRQWRSYLNELDMEKQFFHKDEFSKQHPDASVNLPAILLENDGKLHSLVAMEQINQLTSLDELITALEQGLRTYQ